MEAEEKEVNRKTWWILGVILLILIIGVASYYIWFQQKQMLEMTELFTLEKEMLRGDFEEVTLRFEGMKFSINNDTLIAQIVQQEAKIERLQEELRTVKVTNARQINELKREVETLRKIAQSFAVQIDSLDKENANLKKIVQNNQQKLQSMTQQVTRLGKENENLKVSVQKASMLNAVNIQLLPVNKNDKAAKIDKAVRLILTFSISKNISAPIGEQAIYVRIMRPNDELLKKQNTGRFQFENRDIEYSLIRNIEYDGEEQPIKLYWDIEETLSPGKYRVIIFAAGNQIGSRELTL